MLNSSRRTFVKVGILGAIALAAAGGAYRISKGPSSAAPLELDYRAAAALGAIAAALLTGAVPDTPAMRKDAVARARIAISGLTLATQDEIRDLFSLLLLAPTRRLVAGVPNEWSQASVQDVSTFLQNWRTSRFGLLQAGYQALHDIVIGAWYGDASAWESIGYPGPLKELSE